MVSGVAPDEAITDAASAEPVSNVSFLDLIKYSKMRTIITVIITQYIATIIRREKN